MPAPCSRGWVTVRSNTEEALLRGSCVRNWLTDVPRLTLICVPVRSSQPNPKSLLPLTSSSSPRSVLL